MDRKDFFQTELDVWTVFFRIAAERKKREFDPALKALRNLLSGPEGEDGHDGQGGEKTHKRLMEMEKLLSTVNRIATSALSDEGKAKSLFRFIVDLARGPDGRG